MQIEIDVPDHDPRAGMRFSWVEGYEIEAVIENGEILIFANKEGLISLAKHLLTFAQDTVPGGNHMHLGAGRELNDGSVDLIIGKK